ncbi:hypothetical protein HWV62_36943 [Athelia sp. TMB]|nr:hypothetical protein HWV62_36943 [Athelia sp. TMB]
MRLRGFLRLPRDLKPKLLQQPETRQIPRVHICRDRQYLRASPHMPQQRLNRFRRVPAPPVCPVQQKPYPRLRAVRAPDRPDDGGARDAVRGAGLRDDDEVPDAIDHPIRKPGGGSGGGVVRGLRRHRSVLREGGDAM